MKIEDFKIYQFHFGTNCIALCMCFLASKLGLKFETPPSWAQIWACDWARSQVEPVCEMHWVWVHRLSKIFPKFETTSQLLSLTQGLSLFMKPAPDSYFLNIWGISVIMFSNHGNLSFQYMIWRETIDLCKKVKEFSENFTNIVHT